MVSALLLTAGFYACSDSFTYSVGGSATGVTGDVVLQNNGGDDLTVKANGAFTFSDKVELGKTYAVTIKTKPSGLVCSISNGSGTVTAENVTNVALACSPAVAADRAARYAYVVNSYTIPPVSVCAVNQTTGALTSCIDAGGESVFNNVAIQGIAINSLGTVAYLSNGNGDSVTPYVYQCQIDQTSYTFSSCTSTTVTTPSNYNPYEGLMGLNSTNTMIYLTDSNARVVACPITGGFVSGTCVDTGATPISSNVSGIAVNRAGTKAYIGNYNSPTGVNICNVSGNSFTSCINKTGGSVGGTPFTFNGVGAVALSRSENTVYIPDTGSSTIYGCSTVENVGATFDDCFVANPSLAAYNIVINETNTIAYLTDYSTDVFICSIGSDGTFSSCATFSALGDSTGFALLY